MVMKKGVTLIEVVIVLGILGILIVLLTGQLDPIALMQKANDSRRKKDLNRIKVAFEEYFNDKGCYPKPYNPLSPSLGGYDFESMACDGNGFAPWIDRWICDPNGTHYVVILDSDPNCPRWFKVIANLHNREDTDIPAGWYGGQEFYFGNGHLSRDDYNYGVSSTNISWNDHTLDASCRYSAINHLSDECFVRPGIGSGCQGATNNRCSGSNCFARNDCVDYCQVSCCGLGCP